MQNVVEKLITPTQADVFCHFWNTTGDNLVPYRICEQVDPKLAEIESQIHFDEYLWDHIDYTTKDVDGVRYQHVHSMYYSIYRANELKKRYEREKGFVYDCVVRSRTDLCFDKEFTLDEFLSNPSAVWLSNFEQRPSGMSYADLYAFSNSIGMDIYSKCYENLPDLIRQGNTLLAENILHDYLQNEVVKLSNHTYSVVRVPRE
jgi:hypothetical protein